MKGPVAVVVPALASPALVAGAPIARGALAGCGRRAAAAAVLIALPWYAAMFARHGTAYVDSFLVGDNLERFTTTRFNESRPLWFYLPVIAGGLIPWVGFGLGAAVAGGAALARRQWRPSRDDMRLLSWAVTPTLFFMASVGQQPRYVLPVLPPLAILTARAIGERIEAARRGQRADRADGGGLDHRGDVRAARGAALPAATASRRHAARPFSPPRPSAWRGRRRARHRARCGSEWTALPLVMAAPRRRSCSGCSSACSRPGVPPPSSAWPPLFGPTARPTSRSARCTPSRAT
jgi:hypothetical protein